MADLWSRIRFSDWAYPLWGPAALWLNIRLYGHGIKGDNWTSRLWKRTPWGRWRWERRLARREERRRRACTRFIEAE